jgi:hypothetical protein
MPLDLAAYPRLGEREFDAQSPTLAEAAPKFVEALIAKLVRFEIAEYQTNDGPTPAVEIYMGADLYPCLTVAEEDGRFVAFGVARSEGLLVNVEAPTLAELLPVVKRVLAELAR